MIAGVFMNFDLLAVAPEIIILLGVFIIILNAFHSNSNGLKISIATLVMALFLSLFNISENDNTLFSNHLYQDNLRDIISIFVYLAGLIWILYSEEWKNLNNELFALQLCLILGVVITITAASFVTLFLGLELISLPMYAIIALSSPKINSAIESLLNGLTGISMILYGMSFIYGVTGSLYLPQVHERINLIMVESLNYKQIMLFFGLMMIGMGMSFKIRSLPLNILLPELKKFSILIWNRS